MAFDIGERVVSKFMGAGTVVGEIFKDEEGDACQRIQFDNPTFGEKNYEIKKLQPTADGGDIGA